MEVVAIAVEAIFGEIFVILEIVFLAEFVGFGPGFGFDFEKLDVCKVIGFVNEIVTEFVEKEKLSFVVVVFGCFGIKKLIWRGELKALAGRND